ncbi:hypothetical protein OSTOST_18059 [Ostertagia ostertagi]
MRRLSRLFYEGMNLSSQLLDLVKNKYYFFKSSIDRLQLGIENLRNAPINEADIASLEPQILQLSDRVRYVLARPQLLDAISFSSGLTFVQGLSNLREILPSSRSAFDAKFRSIGAYGMITQVISEINKLLAKIGARL